jgi:hypothetical protein
MEAVLSVIVSSQVLREFPLAARLWQPQGWPFEDLIGAVKPGRNKPRHL